MMAIVREADFVSKRIIKKHDLSEFIQFCSGGDNREREEQKQKAVMTLRKKFDSAKKKIDSIKCMRKGGMKRRYVAFLMK